MKYNPGVLLLLATAGCPTSGTVPPSDASASDDATVGLIPEGDGSTAVQPATALDCADSGRCISGTAALDPAFDVGCVSPQCTTWQVDLFDTYPVGNVRPVGNPHLIAVDGTWSFDGVGADGGAASGYYVQATAQFVFDGGKSVVSSVVGPLALPASQVAINVAPLQAVAYEARLAAGPMKLDWVLAHLFDPSSGAEITSGAEVSVGVEAGALPLTWTATGSVTGYYAAFADAPGALPVYTVTASHPAFGDAGLAVQLVADPPSFDGTITTADAGDGGRIDVGWAPEPQAAFEVVEVYASTGDGGWSSAPAYSSLAPDPPGVTSETTAPLDAGMYLVNVAYTRASCPADAGGCVQASTVSAATVTVP